MRLTVNGDMQDVPEKLTVQELLKYLGLDGPVAVERNAQVVPRAQHGAVSLQANDVIEIVHFVGGG